MDKEEKIKLECKTCRKVLSRDESLKTGGYCWMHKPREPKPKLKPAETLIEKENKAIRKTGVKRCAGCKELKPRDIKYFGRDDRTLDGWKTLCWDCLKSNGKQPRRPPEPTAEPFKPELKGKIVNVEGTAHLTTQVTGKTTKWKDEVRTPKYPGIRAGSGYQFTREGLKDITRLWNEKGYTLEMIAKDHNRPEQTIKRAFKQFMIREGHTYRLKDDIALPGYLRQPGSRVKKPVKPIKKPVIKVNRVDESPGPDALDIINKRMDDLTKFKGDLERQIKSVNRALNELDMVKQAIDQKKYIPSK